MSEPFKLERRKECPCCGAQREIKGILAALENLVTRLQEYIEEQPCDCQDEYGNIWIAESEADFLLSLVRQFQGLLQFWSAVGKPVPKMNEAPLDEEDPGGE